MALGSGRTSPLFLRDDHCGQTLAAVPAVVVTLEIGGMIVGVVGGFVVVIGGGLVVVVAVVVVVGFGVVVVAVVVVGIEDGVVVEVVAGLD